ncbi:hypothetical protein TNCV_4505181 [Trichonephila clavipes]|nr:hypothetical protein TNCV_4505181 [Trichonephila clavipes]
MATPGEITASKNQESPRLTTQSEGASPTKDSGVNFGSFAMYIAELQNITAKFPDIFQALEDMSKETNDINKLNIFLTGGCDVDTRRGGITLNIHIQKSGYRILAPPTPTRYGHNSASTLDLAITTNVDWPCTVTSRSELSSDHNPVTFEFTTTTHFFPPPNKRYTHMKTNWGKFTQNLNVPDNFTLPDANTPEDIDEQIAPLLTDFTTHTQMHPNH